VADDRSYSTSLGAGHGSADPLDGFGAKARLIVGGRCSAFSGIDSLMGQLVRDLTELIHSAFLDSADAADASVGGLAHAFA
jgi:hypothetical protein